MRKVYYNPMPNAAPGLGPLVLLPALLLGPLWAAPQQPAAVRGAAVESHEGLTIAVLPWTDAAQYKEKFPKKAPIAGGVVAIHVSFRNDTAESVRVNLERIRLSIQTDEDNRQELPSISAEQVADAVFQQRHDPTAKVKLPLPLGLGASRDKKWQELQKAAQSAGVASSIVAPHRTVEGLFYFDLRGQLDLLNTAHLYVPEIVVLEKNHQLLFFDVELSRH